MKNIGAVSTTGCHSWCQPHAWDVVSNNSKYYILASCKNVCTQFLHKTATLIYILNRPLIASYGLTKYLCKGSDVIHGSHRKATDTESL